MTDKMEQKAINSVLALLYEEAMLAYKRAYGLTASSAKSRRERAIAHAVAYAMTSAYNNALRLIGPLGSSDLARNHKLPLIDRSHQIRVEMLSEDEISDICTSTYKVSELERKSERELSKTEFLSYIASHPLAVNELAMALDNLANSAVLPDRVTKLNSGTRTNIENARKGGLVRHYMGQGLPKEAANIKAEDDILNGRTSTTEKLSQSKVESIRSNEDIQKAIAQVDGKAYSAYSNRDELMSLLGPSVTEKSETRPDSIENNLSTDKNSVDGTNSSETESTDSIEAESDFSDFDSFDTFDEPAQREENALYVDAVPSSTVNLIPKGPAREPVAASPVKLSQIKAGEMEHISQMIVKSGLLEQLKKVK
ncbi:MAG TPA: hypothetical protein VGF75_08260 [Candidatus Saccharimonadales bacterium]|jgi:hypothetical protein